LVTGSTIRIHRSKLHTVFPEIPSPSARAPTAWNEATCNRQQSSAVFNHPSGFFARAESQWYHQDNSGYTPGLAGDDFFMHNVFVGIGLAVSVGN